MIGIYIIIIYSIAVILSLISFFLYRNWSKKQTIDSLAERPSNTGLPIKGGIENFKIVNWC